MDPRQAVRTKAQVLLGVVCIVFGALPALVALGLAPAPATSPAPPWVGALAGLIFVVGGVCLLVGAARGARAADARLSLGAPAWASPLQYLVVLGVCAAFATLLSWIAFGPGERAFLMRAGAGWGPAPEILGRAVFGLAAAAVWLCVAMILLAALKLKRRR